MYTDISKAVDARTKAYGSNPQALHQRVAQNQQLLDLLALQKVKSDQKAASDHLAGQQEQQPGTLVEQYEQEQLANAGQEIGEKIKGVGGVLQQQRGQQPGQQPPPPGAQGAPMQVASAGPGPGGAPGAAPAGLAAAPRPPMQLAQGGIIGFQSGNEVAERWKTIHGTGGRKDAAAASEGGGLSDAEIAELNNMTPSEYAGLDQKIRDNLRRQTQAPDPLASGISEDLNAAQRQATIRDALNQTKSNTSAAARGLANVWDAGKKYLVGGPEPVPRTADGAGQRQIDTLTRALQRDSVSAPAPAPAAATSPGADLIPEDPTAGFGPGGKLLPPAPPAGPSGAEAELLSPQGDALTGIRTAQAMAEGAGMRPTDLGHRALPVHRKVDTVAPKAEGLAEVERLRRAQSKIDPLAVEKAAYERSQGRIGLTQGEQDRSLGRRQALAALRARQEKETSGLADKAWMRGLGETGKPTGAQRAEQEVLARRRGQSVRDLTEYSAAEAADDAKNQSARIKANASAEKAQIEAEKQVEAGVSGLGNLAKADQDRITANTQRHVERQTTEEAATMLAITKNADRRVQVAAINATAELQKSQQAMEIEIEAVKRTDLSVAKKEALLEKLLEAAQDFRKEMLELAEKEKKLIAGLPPQNKEEQAALMAKHKAIDDNAAAAISAGLKRSHKMQQRLEKQVQSLSGEFTAERR